MHLSLIHISFVVVINRNGKTYLCFVLTDDIFVKACFYFCGTGKSIRAEGEIGILVRVVVYDLVARLNTAVAYAGTCGRRYEKHDLLFAASAE